MRGVRSYGADVAGADERGTRAVGVAGGVHAAVAVVEVVAFAVTGAWVLLADAARASVAAAHHGLILRAVRRVDVAGAGHPDGHEPEHHYWPAVLAGAASAVVGVVVILRGAALIIDPPTSSVWRPPTVAVLGLAAGAGAVALRAVAAASDEVRGRAGWIRFVRHARSPGLPAALVEAVAAVVAPLLGAAAVGLWYLTGNRVWDGVGVTAVGVAVAAVTVAVSITSRTLLVGRSASRRDAESIAAAIEVDPSVTRLVMLSTRDNGPSSVLVGARVELDHTLTFPEVSEVLHRIERNVRTAVPSARTMYIEPDVDEARRAAPTIDEHEPGHDVPEAIRTMLDTGSDRGAMGSGIPVESDPA